MWWTIFSVITGLLILVLRCSTRSRRKNEPPLDNGWIPWLGHAMEFKKDAAKFLARMKEKHGDIFTVCVVGRRVTVLLDPNSFDSVLNDRASFDYVNIRNLVTQKVFSLQLGSSEPTSERMKEHFQGHSLSSLCSSMKIHLQNLLLHCHNGCTPSEWKQDGLFDLCYSLLFKAGYLTLFEKDNAEAVYKEFRKFDNLLPKLARSSLNREESKIASCSQERLWELLSPHQLRGGSESRTWQQRYCDILQQEGIDADVQKKALLLQLWTTQCNVGPAAFWLLGFLLTHPEAMEAVKSEIRGLSTLRDTSFQHPQINSLEAHSTPVLDSALSETLRLTAAVMIRREVVKHKILNMGNGQKYHLRQGDIVCMFPFLSPQTDPKIHQEPQSFKYDRFLNEDMTVKNTFYKNGKRLKYYTMPWGSGNNSCIGKAFAVKTLKQFVFLALTHLDLELYDPEAKLPPVNPSRYGFGMLQPDGDLQVRYRQKRTQREM